MQVALSVDSIWVMLCTILVVFMQTGFVLLEAGASRMKNAGHIAGKQLFSFSIATLMFWAFGYAIIFGHGEWIGTSGWFLSFSQEQDALPNEMLFLFQLAFAAVSLAIVWGGFAERAKFSAYVVFGTLFPVIIYPVVGHWIWGEGGWLHEMGKQDFAGSTVVHLTGGVAALVATCLLGPRMGKYSADGKPQAIPGHNQVYSVLGVLIIWLGWFGFNPGSTLNAQDGFFAYVALTTNLAAVGGALAAMIVARAMKGKVDIPSMLNGLLAALVAITASCAFVEPWAAVLIGIVAGALCVYAAHVIEKWGIDDPVCAFSVHGVAGIWGSLSTGFFAAPHLVEKVGIGQAGLFYGGGFEQLWVQALGVAISGMYVAVVTFVILWVFDRVVGLRVSAEEERLGLDLSEHGSPSYPELVVAAMEMPRMEQNAEPIATVHGK